MCSPVGQIDRQHVAPSLPIDADGDEHCLAAHRPILPHFLVTRTKMTYGSSYFNPAGSPELPVDANEFRRKFQTARLWDRPSKLSVGRESPNGRNRHSRRWALTGTRKSRFRRFQYLSGIPELFDSPDSCLWNEYNFKPATLDTLQTRRSSTVNRKSGGR
jgi:hypothetical protein